MSVFRKLFYSFPPSARFWVRRFWFLPYDLFTYYLNPYRSLAPPKGLTFVGSGDFLGQGKRFLNHFIELGGLQSHHKVLDVGCGIGRMAIPMTNFLNPKLGSYEGFDPMPVGIKWCKEHISVKYPNFNFTLVDVVNDLYINNVPHDGSTFVFPYGDSNFDFCFLTSVFTHLLPAETSNYFSEINRVLKPGARCFATFFVLDEQSKQKIKSGHSSFNFPYPYDENWVLDLKSKAANVGYEEEWLKKASASANLNMIAFYPGSWRGDLNTKDFQDICVFEKAR